jgi:hypothetical protein
MLHPFRPLEGHPLQWLLDVILRVPPVLTVCLGGYAVLQLPATGSLVANPDLGTDQPRRIGPVLPATAPGGRMLSSPTLPRLAGGTELRRSGVPGRPPHAHLKSRRSVDNRADSLHPSAREQVESLPTLPPLEDGHPV